MKDTKTPLKVSAVTLLIHIAFCFLFLYTTPLKHASLALATSVAYCLNGLILYHVLKRKFRSLHIPPGRTGLAGPVARLMCNTAVMLFTVLSLRHVLPEPGTFFGRIAVLLVLVAAGLTSYGGMSILLPVREVSQFFDRLRGRAEQTGTDDKS